MARPKSFDVDDVLDRAVDVFWTKGLAATSIEDLVGELGINRGSLYATFNSKEELFHRALERYHQGSLTWIAEMLAGDDRPLRVRLEDLLHAGATGNDHRGCFMMNTATERNSIDGDCRTITSEAIHDLSRIVSEAFARAQHESEPGNRLDPPRSPDEAAAVVLTALQGLRTLATMSEAAACPDPTPMIDLVLDALFGAAPRRHGDLAPG